MCHGKIDKIVPKSVANMLESEPSGSGSQESDDSPELREEDTEIDFSKLDQSVKVLNDDALDNHLKLLSMQQVSIKSKMEEIRPNIKV